MKISYLITGKIGRWHEHYQDGLQFKGREFGEVLSADSDKEAISKAKEIEKGLYKKYEHVAPDNEIPKFEGADEGCYEFRLIKIIVSYRGNTEIKKTKVLWGRCLSPGILLDQRYRPYQKRLSQP